jgi:hypothetical protein
VVEHQHVTGELPGRHLDDLRALSDQGVLVGADEADLSRVGWVGDVDHVHPAVGPTPLRPGAVGPAPAGQVGVVPERGQVGDEFGFGVVDGELADELDPAPVAVPVGVSRRREDVPGG